ncbi:ABC transporter permease [Micromonospora sp. NPDC048839]|uniref:ABC transporter permease n=1 Tax=Micromonospora sp. NPDC048839 TaxID=3155641 RepID=UPI0033DE12AE
MTAPAVNGTKYPQPVEALLPEARKILKELGEVPARNELMRRFRIGAPKAGELRNLLTEEDMRRRMREQFDYTPPDERTDERAVDPWDYAEPIGPNPAPVESERVETLRAAMISRGALLPPAGASWTDPVVPESAPMVAPDPTPVVTPVVAEPVEQVAPVSHPGTTTPDEPARKAVVWPVVLMALGAFVAVWSGWVGLGKLTGFGMVDLLPGIVEPGSWATIDSAITLPIGVEAYAAYALYVWLSGRVPDRARTFAKWSALASLAVGALGQVAYHLLVAYGVTSAPWWITTLVSCLPVAVLGMGAALAHLVREDVKR